MEMEKARRKSLVSKIKQSIEQNRGCGVLYLDTVTPDGFGSPKMKITVKYTGENGEIKLHFGSVKPEAVTFDLVRVFITKLLKILCFTAFKTYSDRALPIKNR